MAKYKNKKVQMGEFSFDSKKEASTYCILKSIEGAGEIYQLEVKSSACKFPIIINGVKICTYIADFAYLDKEGRKVVVDVKGYRTDVYKLKKKLVYAVYGIEIQEL